MSLDDFCCDSFCELICAGNCNSLASSARAFNDFGIDVRWFLSGASGHRAAFGRPSKDLLGTVAVPSRNSLAIPSAPRRFVPLTSQAAPPLPPLSSVPRFYLSDRSISFAFARSLSREALLATLFHPKRGGTSRFGYLPLIIS